MADQYEHYLLYIGDDVFEEWKLKGPFDTDTERDAEAVRIRDEEGDEHGLFKVYAWVDEGKPMVEVVAFSGAEL
jgi:hypothetical protein